MGSADAATEPTPVPTIDIDGAWYSQPDTSFGVDWRISYPDGVSDAGWSTYCSVDGQAEAQCTPETVNAMTLAEGKHIVTLTPRNPDDGQDGETYTWKLVVDVSAPVPIELDKTPLVRMGQDITLPVLFDDPQTKFEWYCYDYSAASAIGTTKGIVIPSPESDLTVAANYDCTAMNDRDLTGHLEDLLLVWDAEKPESYLPTGIPRLMTHPVGFRMKAYDDGTAAADEPMRIFAQRRVLTPRMTWRRWRTPDRWVTTKRRPSRPGADWSRGFRLDHVPRGYSVCVRPGARDAVGRRNVAGRACTTRAWDDRDLRRGKGWTEISPRGSYQGTALRTRRYGARLKLTRPAQGRAAAILVRKCPACGRIQVIGPDNPYWGVPNLEYSLRARKAHWVKLPVSWLNHRYHGDYTIKVVSSGRPVVIDGLAVSPWPIHDAADWRHRQYHG